MIKNKYLIAASIVLAAFYSQAQEKRAFIENVGVKINYARTFNFDVDNNNPLYQWEMNNFSTFRLGLSYDLESDNRLTYNFNLSIDWLIYKRSYVINDFSFNETPVSRSIKSNGTVYFIGEAQFLYAINKSKTLKLMAAPQINFFLFNDAGSSSTNGSDPNTGYAFSFESTDRNRIIRPSLALGLQYDLNTKTKMRIGGFYSFSFTPIEFGEFTYENSNGVRASGDWKQQGHQAGITFQIFPFFKRNSN